MENCQGKRRQNENAGNDDQPPVKKVPRMYKCSKCPFQNPGKSHMKKHEEIHKHRGLPFNCKYCHASFFNAGGKWSHEMLHQVETGPRVQLARRTQTNHQDEAEENDDVQIHKPVKKSIDRPRARELVQRAAPIDVVQNGAGPSSTISNYVNACPQFNLVTLHDVNTAHGTIGKITLQFQCNKCRGRLGVARCHRGRSYCVICCGHPECD